MYFYCCLFLELTRSWHFSLNSFNKIVLGLTKDRIFFSGVGRFWSVLTSPASFDRIVHMKHWLMKVSIMMSVREKINSLLASCKRHREASVAGMSHSACYPLTAGSPCGIGTSKPGARSFFVFPFFGSLRWDAPSLAISSQRLLIRNFVRLPRNRWIQRAPSGNAPLGH